MTLEQIKAAVLAGKVVHWRNAGYTVAEDSKGQWLIVCTANNSAICLTLQDGVTLNGKSRHFYIENLMYYTANSNSKPRHSLELSFRIAKYRGKRLDHHKKALKLKGYTDEVFCLAEKDVNLKFNL